MWERRAATTPLTAPPTAPPPAPSTTQWTPGIEGEMSPVVIESFFEIFYVYWVTYQNVDLGRGVLPAGSYLLSRQDGGTSQIKFNMRFFLPSRWVTL